MPCYTLTLSTTVIPKLDSNWALHRSIMILWNVAQLSRNSLIRLACVIPAIVNITQISKPRYLQHLQQHYASNSITTLLQLTPTGSNYIINSLYLSPLNTFIWKTNMRLIILSITGYYLPVLIISMFSFIHVSCLFTHHIALSLMRLSFNKKKDDFVVRFLLVLAYVSISIPHSLVPLLMTPLFASVWGWRELVFVTIRTDHKCCPFPNEDEF